MNRKELIEEAAKAMQHDIYPGAPTWGGVAEGIREDWRNSARAALAVFEKAHAPTLHDLDDVIEDLGIDLSDDAPTDDEREALVEAIDDVLVRWGEQSPSPYEVADGVLAAGFRRTEVLDD